MSEPTTEAEMEEGLPPFDGVHADPSDPLEAMPFDDLGEDIVDELPDEEHLTPSAPHQDGLGSDGSTSIEVPDTGVWGFLKAHPQELTTGLSAVLLVVVLVELFKPWVKGIAIKRKWDDHDLSRVLKTVPYVFGLGVAYVFDFKSNWYELSGAHLSMTESVVVGALFTGAGAQVAYMAAKEFRVVEVMRLKWYRFMGVTSEDLDAVAKTDPIGPDAISDDSEDIEDDPKDEDSE